VITTYTLLYLKVRVRVMAFNATFNNISAISWRSFYWWRKPEYPVTDKLLSYSVVSNQPRL